MCNRFIGDMMVFVTAANHNADITADGKRPPIKTVEKNQGAQEQTNPGLSHTSIKLTINIQRHPLQERAMIL